MVTKEEFEKLENDPIIGSTVKEIREAWIKNGNPESDYDRATTEMHGLNPGYWTDFERGDEPYADYYNSLLDSLLDLVDVRNIASVNNPIFYVNAFRDAGFSEFEDDALAIIKNDADYIYQKVCELSEEKLKELGYEVTEEDDEDEEA